MSIPVKAADWPYGLRCPRCDRELVEGDLYCEELESFVGDTPCVLIVCDECFGKEDVGE